MGWSARLDLVDCVVSRFQFLSLRLSKHCADVGKSKGLRCIGVLPLRPSASGFCDVVVCAQWFCLRCPVSRIDTDPALRPLRILDSDDHLHFGLHSLHPNRQSIHNISPGILTARSRMGLWQCERKVAGSPSRTEQHLGVCA